MQQPDPAHIDRATVLGCYGLGLAGLDGARHYMSPVEQDAPVLQVTQATGFLGPRPDEDLAGETALLHLSDGVGYAELNRARRSARLHVADAYADEALLHPMLSSSCAVTNRWLGRDSFHAGAFALGPLAWVVIGDRGMGKSTTLGYLATREVPVVTDDLVIVDAGYIYPGPAFVDLRPDAADGLGLGRDVGYLGSRRRARFDVAPIGASRIRLGGWIILGWGASVALTPVPLPDRIGLLYDNRVVRTAPVDPSSYLRHAALPFYRLTRPKDWSTLPEVYTVLKSELN